MISRKRKLLLRKIKRKLISLYHAPKTFFYNVVRVVRWLPVIWGDRDWDFSFILNILAFKLRMSRKCLTFQNGERADEILYAEALIERITENDYCAKEWVLHEEKWGKLDMGREPTSNGYYILDMHRVKARELGMEDVERKESSAIIMLEESRLNLDYETLFTHIKDRIRGWWD